MKKLKTLSKLLMLSLALILTSCVPPTPIPEPTLTVSPSTQTVTVGGTAVAFTATLTNSTDTITWQLAGAGTLDTTTGATVNYTPPATGGATTATLTASAAGKTAVATVTVNAPAGTPSLSISPPTSTTTVGGGAIAFAASLQNSTDSPNNIVWALSGTGGGTLTVAAGALTSFTPPSTGAGGTTTLTATLGALSASATITINAATVPTLVVSPKTRDLIVEGVAVTFSAALTNSTDTITWSLTGAGSIPANSTGTTVEYTPPATGGATTATLTATAGALSDSAAITIAAKPVSTITVTGKVLNFDGTAAAGVNVQIDDVAAGLKTTKTLGPVASGADGSFSISGVQAPYTLSVIPNDGVNAPQSWSNVTRTDPTLVINPLAGPSAFCTTPAPGTLTVNFAQAVDAGNTANVVYIAPGINQFELSSNVSNLGLGAGTTTTNLNVTFDTSLCQTSVTGKVLYFELNGNTLVKTASIDATVITGNTQTVTITQQTAATQSVSGTVTFPSGSGAAGNITVNLIARVGPNASFTLPGAVAVNSVLPTYEFAAPVIPGVSYYTLAFGQNDAGTTFKWQYSDVISTLPAVKNLSLPNDLSSSAPSGASGTDTTPTFSYTPVTGANLYSTALQNVGGAPTIWLGQANSTSITIPSLPAPARLNAGSEITPTTFTWLTNALTVRAGGDSDTLLDGRQVKKFYVGAGFVDLLTVLNPDIISAGSISANATTFTLP